MKILIASLVALTLVSACRERRADDSASTGFRSSADTVVTQRQTEDTAVVRHDTIIRADTVKKRGARPTKVDTVRKS
ncbi:MAG TPA: hypothetical protein VFS33_03555 [Gemmatimonadales bacterium]|nr:hypothetical protein [Gemmatimonadales bacterium]